MEEKDIEEIIGIICLVGFTLVFGFIIVYEILFNLGVI